MKDVKLAVGTMGPLPTKQDREDLMVRLQAVRTSLTPRIQELREAEEWKRWANVQVQEELCAKMEALVPLAETDPEKASNEMRTLQERWKPVAAAPRSQAEALWTRFKTAQEQVYDKCKDFFALQATERVENLKKKEALCLRAESMADSTDWVKTADAMKTLQAEWKSIGAGHARQREGGVGTLPRGVRQVLHAPPGRSQAAQAGLDREPEAQGSARRRSEAALGIHRVGAGRVAHQAPAGRLEDDRPGEEEQVGRDLERVPRRVRPVLRAFQEPRFRWRCRARWPIANRRSTSSKRCCRPRMPTDAAAPDDLYAKVQAARARWVQGPELPRHTLAPLAERVNAALFNLVTRWPDGFKGTDIDPELTKGKMEKLIAKVEKLLPTESAEPAKNLSPAELLARQWREALAANTMGAGASRQAEDARQRAAEQEVRSAQAAWARLGPLAPEQRKPLQDRFDRAVRKFSEMRRRSAARA